ncbi:hypothetical protein Tco_0653041 [Tanacetum coccineum]|uniref:Uncharacterized protein n=1 Tax=Tanacetum coccineum TaxID=301880 RepID=A0ABQ4WZB1_9ASTR
MVSQGGVEVERMGGGEREEDGGVIWDGRGLGGGRIGKGKWDGRWGGGEEWRRSGNGEVLMEDLEVRGSLGEVGGGRRLVGWNKGRGWESGKGGGTVGREGELWP